MTNELIEPTLIEGHELSDCPHCGETPTVTLHPGHAHTGALAGFMQEVGDSYTAECCGGMIEGSLQELRERWNNRAAPDHWVPVSERLPEKGVTVLVLHDFGRAVSNHQHPDYGKRYGHRLSERASTGFMSEFFETGHVTHWMPLPAAPEVGRE